MEFLERDINAFHREDHYLANIALEVRRSWVKSPEQEDKDAFMLEFTRGDKQPNYGMTSKEIWCGFLGVKTDV